MLPSVLIKSRRCDLLLTDLRIKPHDVTDRKFTIFKPCDIYAYIQFYTVCRKSNARIKKNYIPNQLRPEGVIEFMIITETDSLYRI